MIQSVLRSLTSSPAPAPEQEDSDYDVSLSTATISQHVVSKRSPMKAPRTPQRPQRPLGPSKRSPAPMAAVYELQQTKFQETMVNEAGEVVDVGQVVNALKSIEALMAEPANRSDEFRNVYVSSARQLVAAIRGQNTTADKDKKDRSEVIMGIIVVSMKIIRLSIELATPLVIQFKDLWMRMINNETFNKLLETFAEIILVGLSMVLTILKMLQRWLGNE